MVVVIIIATTLCIGGSIGRVDQQRQGVLAVAAIIITVVHDDMMIVHEKRNGPFSPCCALTHDLSQLHNRITIVPVVRGKTHVGGTGDATWPVRNPII
jgi:hypothetical protein